MRKGWASGLGLSVAASPAGALLQDHNAFACRMRGRLRCARSLAAAATYASIAATRALSAPSRGGLGVDGQLVDACSRVCWT